MPLPRRIKKWRWKNRGPAFAVGFFNADYTKGAERGIAAFKRALAQKVFGLRPVLVLGVECKMFDAHNHVPDGWAVLQDRTGDAGRRGCLMAYDPKRVRVLTWRLVFTTDGGPETLDRYALRAVVRIDGEAYTVTVNHLVPKRARKFWLPQMRTWKRVLGDINAADFNEKRARLIARVLGLKVLLTEVVGFAVPRKYPTSRLYKADIDTDHPFTGFVMWPRKRKP